VRARTLALLVVAVVLAGCGSGAANKAGGTRAPTVLTVGDSDDSDQPDTAAIQHFARQVDRLSAGALQIHIVYQAAGAATPYVEERVIRAVRSGRFDLGWIGTRAWDKVGVTSFRAIQAPFLITSTRLLDRVASGPLATEMLSSLSSLQLVGMAVVPDLLRHPVGLNRKLTSPADFAGARIRIQPSQVTAALMRALGAVPVELSNQQVGYSIGGNRIDGEEMSLANAVSPSIVTGNLVFFPKALTLFANERRFDRLSDDQRRILRTAAEETVRHTIARAPPDAGMVKNLCTNERRLVLATASDRAALRRLAQPVYRMLEADPQTKRFIERIQKWKATTPADPPLKLTGSCEQAQSVAQAKGAPRPPSLLNGTYRWVVTRADALKGSPNGPSPGDTFPTVSTAVLRDGRWSLSGADHDHGTYSIRDDQVRFFWPRIPSTLVFRFTRDADGTLHLRPVPPMDPGDQFVWAYKPWQRIGPPTRP
jgi:TRAP-type C4-dicarboxylate transport system substrate-binding protein